jgi:hypothetical protein
MEEKLKELGKRVFEISWKIKDNPTLDDESELLDAISDELYLMSHKIISEQN